MNADISGGGQAGSLDLAANITEREQLTSLPNNSVIEDCSGDVGSIFNGKIWHPETAPLSLGRATRYLPATVVHQGTE
ncbi:hypothetical protein [Paeniglutamicibacter kerguelensis]|uniref:Uncharacterized protein n=1 Tax=Paeniglutamicibacter kerguelensis TaxID=254788 RepID=A0ABS4XA89_9MICC|nr:hypothetical protein [Paeniglutamicibacter kerguelensis]MBP2385372.1 hypothetical protein [Paeniglutamicibacter kerguelensis]